MAVAASDLVGDLIAQTPQGKVLESKFKGLSDIALARGQDAGLHLRRHPLHAQHQQRRERQRRQPRLRRRRRRFGGGGGGRRRAAAADVAAAAGSADSAAAAAPGPSGAAGFGVRVIHSGVWGFASSPIVTEDEIRRITRMATEVAKASAIAKQHGRQAGAGAGLHRVLGDADQEGPARRCPQDDKQASSRRSSTPSSRRRKSPTSTPRCSSSTSGSTSRLAKAPTSSRRSSRRRRRSP